MILVTGATGNVGAELVQILVHAGEKVRTLSRTPDASRFSTGVEIAVGDLDQAESLRQPLRGVRRVFLLSGYADMPRLLKEMRRADVEQVVLLSGGAAVAADTDNAISRYMLRSEAAVRDSGVPWTLIRPTGFMSNTFQWMAQLRAGNVVRAPFADIPVAMIDPHDVAAVAAQPLLSDGHGGRSYRPTGPESLLPADRLNALAAVLGRKLVFEPMSDEDARTQMEQAMPTEYVDAFFSFNTGGTLDESQVLSTVQQITGREPFSFHQWATTHAAAFT